jgi:hypothetical protein
VLVHDEPNRDRTQIVNKDAALQNFLQSQPCSRIMTRMLWSRSSMSDYVYTLDPQPINEMRKRLDDDSHKPYYWCGGSSTTLTSD